MKAFDRLREEVFHFGTAPEWLRQRWPPDSAPHRPGPAEPTQPSAAPPGLAVPLVETGIRDRAYPYAYCVYVEREDGVEVAKLSFLSGPVPWGPPGRLHGLVEHLNSGQPGGYRDVLFLLDSYLAAKRTEASHGKLRRSLVLGSRRGKAIEELLAETRGCLLWDWQLENLLGMFFIRTEERIALRKGLNAAQGDARSAVDSVSVEDGISLGQLIDDRWHGATLTPSVSGAFVIYRELCEHGAIRP